MSAKASGIPRYKTFKGPRVFQNGFRPFFFGAGLWAALAMALWIAAFAGLITIPTAFDPLGWHAHEMIYGFVPAAMAGFLLTAIPNWTGRMPLQGLSLIGLFSVWILGRVATAFSSWIGLAGAAFIDLSFLALLLAVVLREIVAGRNWRNLPVVMAVGALFIASLLTYYEAVEALPPNGFGPRLGIAIVVMLINLIGGRIIPSFTHNWLKKQGAAQLPAPLNWFDKLSMALSGVALAAWVFLPGASLAGGLLLLAGVAAFVRLARWRGYLTYSEPLVLILHVAFLWVPVGLFLLGLSFFTESMPAIVGLHALTAGAMGGMILAVMTRATLGHSGRALAADRVTALIYLAVTAAALTRVAAPLLPFEYFPLLMISAALWLTAFGLFTIHYGRILLRA